MRRRGLTIRDVAARAGVSTAAVSQALNGTGTLSAATRARIVEVAEEMGYQADAIARGLQGARLGAVGLVFRSLDALEDYNPEGVDVFSRIAGMLSVELLERGRGVMLLRDLVTHAAPPLAYSMDGYIVVNPHHDDPVLRRLDERGLSYVTIGRDPGRPDRVDWVSTDDDAGMTRMLDHLADAGARRILLVRGTDPNAWNIDSENAFRRWCAETGRADPVVVTVPERAGVDGGRAFAGALADGAHGPLPDAIVCMTGRHAAGTVAALAERGIRVPDALLVATMSDSEHSRTATPSITCMTGAVKDEVRATVAMLLAILAGAPPGEPAQIHTEVVVRASTVPPRPPDD